MTELTREQIYSEYSDTYKAVYGMRPRFNWLEYTFQELHQMYDELLVFARQEFDEERQREEDAKIKFKNTLNKLAQYCDVSIAQVLYWLYRDTDYDSYQRSKLGNLVCNNGMASYMECVLYRVMRKGGFVSPSDPEFRNERYK